MLDGSRTDAVATPGRVVRTRLYFTSESHLQTLLNVLRFPLPGAPSVITSEGARQLAETRVQQRIAHRLRVLVLAHRAKLELAYQAADCAASGGTATGVLPMQQWAETTQQVRRRTAEPDPEPSPCPRHRANQWR